MKQSKKVVARIIILILALFTVIPGTVSQKVYAEPGGSESSQAEDASKDDSNKKEEKKEEDMTPEEREKKAEEDAYKMEIQSNGWKNWPKGPGTYGEAAIVMDAGTGSILYAKNIDEHEYPASITKVLTSLIALKYGNLSDKVTFSNDCISFMQPGDSSVGLKEGNVISLEQALYATLLASANEAAYAVAENVGKNAGHDYDWFIQQMNEECKSLGGKNSNFVNANGLHDDNHYTCARDMALIGREIWRYPEFLKICQEQLVCVVLRTHGVNIYPDTKNLFEYAFNNFQKIQVADEKKPDEVEKFISAADSQSDVSAQSDGSEDTESVQTGGNEYQPLEDGYVILPKDVSYKDIDYEITDVDEDTGEGTIRYIYDGHQVGSATAKFTDKYLQKVSTRKERVDSKPKDVDNSGDSKKNGGKSSAKSIWKNFLQKVKAVWDFGQKKFAGKSSTEKYMIAGGCVALVILIFSLIVLLIRRRR